MGVSDQFYGWMIGIMKLIDEYQLNFGFSKWFLVSGFDEKSGFVERERGRTITGSVVHWGMKMVNLKLRGSGLFI